MAFVNNKGGDRVEMGQAASGQPVDFDPNDPDVVKVHYDVSVWTFDQRGELFDRLEELFGPFPIVLLDDAPSTEFGLDEWPDADRKVLAEALVDAEIPHRWHGSTVVVAEDAESAVDDLLDAIEAGELTGPDTGDTQAPPDGALGTMFVAADKLAKDPMDAGARSSLIDLVGRLDPKHPPYGLSVRIWAAGVDGVRDLVDRFGAQAAGGQRGADHESDIIGAAQELRALLRSYV